MATRSRRSASGADNLNPAMIYLLDAVRLRKELQLRGLDTTGNKSILADRLQVCIVLFFKNESFFLFDYKIFSFRMQFLKSVLCTVFL